MKGNSGKWREKVSEVSGSEGHRGTGDHQLSEKLGLSAPLRILSTELPILWTTDLAQF